MTYSTAAQVQGLIQRIYAEAGFTASTAPTATQLATMQAQTAAEIDLYLSTVGLATPVTAPAATVTWLSLVEAQGVAAMALKSNAPESIVSESGGPVIPAYAFWEKRYRDALELIVSGQVRLDGATTPGARSYLTDYPDNDPFNDGSSEGQQPLASMSSRLRDF